MSKKIAFLVLPLAIIPYLPLFFIFTMINSTNEPWFDYILDHVFSGNIFYLCGVILAYIVIAANLSILCFILSLSEKWDPLVLAKASVAIKLYQTPAYIVAFVFGLLFLLSIFTYVFTFLFLFINCLTLLLTGLLTLACIINSVRKNLCTFEGSVWVILMQFVFGADVIATIIFYKKLKKDYICRSL